MTARTWGIAAVIAAAVLWGTTGTVQALLPPDRAPLAVGALRLAIGAVSLIVLAAVQIGRIPLRTLPWPGIIAAGIAIGGYNLLFFRAVSEAGVGIGTAITIGSAPIWATVVETVQTRHLPRPIRLLGQALSITGVAVLSASGEVTASTLGIALALGAGACYAAYSLITSRISHRAPSTAIAAATFTVAALVALPVLAITPIAWAAAPAPVAALLFLGIGATGLSYALYTLGLGRVAASTGVTLALAEPVTAWILALLIVGESATLPGMSGVALILIGLVLVTRPAPQMASEARADGP
ncbi:EamA family transporter [Palleronia sp. THAF1]|uniref:EamA family transporter n=1 Tax=Palleronia sp. THAF1 TaxID=2587842 RepID=UPI000F54216E|nr:DMT family transporter [Palleronia sp. THAF1]